MSIRCSQDEKKFIITGRNVHKGKLSTQDLVLIEGYDSLNEHNIVGQVRYVGCVKPSIDAAIHYHIYEARPDVNAIIHVHTDIEFSNIPTTSYNYPCGCHEEVSALLELINQNPGNDVFQMTQHGLLILGESLNNCLKKLDNLFHSKNS